jgi:hypothetical protein
MRRSVLTTLRQRRPEPITEGVTGELDTASPDGTRTLLCDRPILMTIEEAASILRIGRTAAYEQARIWRETDGREGIPVIYFGRTLRVPRAALEKLLEEPVTIFSARTRGDRRPRAS